MVWWCLCCRCHIKEDAGISISKYNNNNNNNNIFYHTRLWYYILSMMPCNTPIQNSRIIIKNVLVVVEIKCLILYKNYYYDIIIISQSSFMEPSTAFTVVGA